MTKRTGYYVTAKHSPDGQSTRTAWLCGPFETFKAALAMVPAVSAAARARLTDAAFRDASYGVSERTGLLPPGQLDLTASVDDAWIINVTRGMRR